MTKAKRVKRCRTPTCKRRVYVRSVCHACYELMRQAVNSGETCWQDLEAVGAVAPRLTESNSAPVHAMIAKAKEQSRLKQTESR